MCFVIYPLACVFVDIEKMRRLDGALLALPTKARILGLDSL